MKRGLLPAAAALAVVAGMGLAGGRGDREAARFGELPVLHEGRIKPFEAVARSTLLLLKGKQAVQDGKRALSPSEWLLDVTARPEKSDGYAHFRLDDPELKAALSIPEGGGRYYSFNQLKPGLEALEPIAARAESMESGERTRVQTAALHLYQRLVVYQRLKHTLRPSGAEDFASEVAAPAGDLGSPSERRHGGASPRQAGDLGSPSERRHGGPSARAKLGERVAGWSFMAEAALARPLPPLAGQGADDWKSEGQALMDAHAGTLHPGALPLAKLGDAWRTQDKAAFASALGELAALAPASAKGVRWESAFHRAAPFTWGMVFYLAAGLLVLASWFTDRKGLARAGYGALAAAVAVHSAGLLARMLIEARPPVTNLYSSAVFVGWIGGLVGLWQERRSGGGLAAAAASALGFCTLIIAHHLSTQGDTMEMMRAVLDSNFWLATHVVAITVGYGAAFLAGTLAHVYFLRGVLTKSLDKDSARQLVGMTYFAVCLSLFFSFVGTVLGGIWADQSWGRFWGWDPKENGALLIVLWLAILLHARWGGFVRDRGVMAMAVFGNVVTALSWFGVNMLGIGLHSYGFMEGAMAWLALFVAAELAVMALGAVPPQRWKSPQALA